MAFVVKNMFVSSRKMGVAAMLTAGMVLAGCASPPIPMNYAPASTKSINGSLSVGSFTYLPAMPGAPKMVASNVIRNTAIGELKIDKDVNVFVRDAVFLELRAMGAKVNNPSKVLTGEIQEFLVDDLGYSIDWTLRIKYSVTDANAQTTTYTSVKESKRKTAKGPNPFGALNETIKLNTEQLVDDPEFIKAIQ